MTIISIPTTSNVADPEAKKVLDALRVAVETLAGRQGITTDQAVLKSDIGKLVPPMPRK